MPLGANYVGGTVEVPARLIAALQADGHQEKNWMKFHFHKPRKRERIIQLAELYGYEWKEYQGSGGYYVSVKGNEWPKDPGAYMFNWTKQCLLDFLDELKYWDGHIGPTAVSLHSSKRENLEWYQTFGRILGIGGNIQKPKTSGFGTTMYALQQNKRQFANGASCSHEKIEVTDVRVLCPTVSSTFFYVRRNGKIYVTGNSNYLGQPRTMSKHAKVPVREVETFQRNYFSAFPCIPQYHQHVRDELRSTASLTTLFGRRRFFFGRDNDDATIREAVAYCPQSMTADEIDTGILNLWRANRVQLLIQVHDSILFQYPEHLEDEIIPWALAALRAPLTLARGREFVVPTEAKVGWNWGEFDKDQNPDGLVKWRGGDDRKRTEHSGKLSIIGR
jgi:hypothetical protein